MEPAYIIQKSASREDEFLYIRVSDQLENTIRQNVLKTGEKLPSVRSLSREQGISISTAFKAYAHLEDKGLIEARPKSGYYVRFMAKLDSELPKTQLPGVPLQAGSVDEIVAGVFRDSAKEGVVNLSLAVPHLSLLPQARLNKSMMEAIRSCSNSCIGYEQLQGNPELRRQIARQAINRGEVISEEEVVTTHGCMEALVFCLKAVTNPGDTVAIDSPTYFGIFTVITSLGLKIKEMPHSPETGIELDYLEEALEEGEIKACLFVTSFTNPTGSCMPAANKKRLTDILAQKGIPLIEDDIYGELYFGKERPRTCKSYDRKGLVMLCSSVSKTLAPGYRVGWCMPGRFKEKLLAIKRMNSVSSANPTQAAIAHFFKTGRYDLHMRKLRKALHTQCLKYLQAVSAYFPEDTRVSRPQGGYVLWVEMNEKVNALLLYQKAAAHKIIINPGLMFSAQANYPNYIRLSFGAPFTPELGEAIRTLGSLAKRVIKG